MNETVSRAGLRVPAGTPDPTLSRDRPFPAPTRFELGERVVERDDAGKIKRAGLVAGVSTVSVRWDDGKVTVLPAATAAAQLEKVNA